MKKGDRVLISPDVTHQTNWIEGEIIKIEDNSFVGKVISAQTYNGDVFFSYQNMFIFLMTSFFHNSLRRSSIESSLILPSLICFTSRRAWQIRSVRSRGALSLG